MPELYSGQAQVVAGKLQQARLLQSADEDQAKAAENPSERASIRRRMASRIGLIQSLERQLAQMSAETEGAEPDARPESPQRRERTIRFRVNEDEETRLQNQAAESGMGLSDYIRLMCGL